MASSVRRAYLPRNLQLPSLLTYVMLVLAGCLSGVPEGKFRCTSDEQCPAGQSCYEQTCWMTLRPQQDPMSADEAGSSAPDSAGMSAMPAAGMSALSPAGHGSAAGVGSVMVSRDAGSSEPSDAGPLPPQNTGPAASDDAGPSATPPMVDTDDAGPTCPTGACGAGGTCVMGGASYRCECRDGYSGDGTWQCTNPRFVVSADTVKDAKTGLTWQRAHSPRFAQREHAAYCKNLQTAGGGWRVPALTELEALVDPGTPQGKPKIDWTVFEMPRLHWTTSTSTTMVEMDGQVGDIWFVRFEDGDRTWATDAYLSRVRCVR
jgi:hypothetical protein